MRKFGKVNTLNTSVTGYNYMLLGEGGVGKTTLVSEFGKLVGKSNETTFIITVGLENKTDHIPDAFSEVAGDYKTLTNIIDDLCNNRADYPDTKYVAIDSVDELVRITEAYVVKEYNATLEDLTKRVYSVRQAYGGYQGGENKVVDNILNLLGKLTNAGYHYFLIGHTKIKSRTDAVTGYTYDQLTCTIDNKYYTALKDKVNVVAVGYFEKEFKNLKKKDNPYTKEKNAITTGELVGQRRALAFADNDNVIDTKCHFEYIVPKTDFCAQSFITAIEDAIKKKMDNTVAVHEVKPLPDADEEELVKTREFVRAQYKAADADKKSEVKAYLDAKGIKLDAATMEQLDELKEILEA